MNSYRVSQDLCESNLQSIIHDLSVWKRVVHHHTGQWSPRVICVQTEGGGMQCPSIHHPTAGHHLQNTSINTASFSEMSQWLTTDTVLNHIECALVYVKS